MLNRVDLYVSLLRSYSSSQRHAARDIREALAAGNRGDATRYAHTANGLAGQIGSEAVRAPAERLESILRAGERDDEIDAALSEVEAALAVVIGSLDTHLPERRQNPRLPKNGELTSTDLAALEQIVRLLEEYDPKARTLWHAHAAAFADAIPEATYVLVTAAVDTFNFDAAPRGVGSERSNLPKPH